MGLLKLNLTDKNVTTEIQKSTEITFMGSKVVMFLQAAFVIGKKNLKRDLNISIISSRQQCDQTERLNKTFAEVSSHSDVSPEKKTTFISHVSPFEC